MGYFMDFSEFIENRENKKETITIRLKNNVQTVLDKNGISMKNGVQEVWQENSWDSYTYDNKFFIINKNGSPVGFYNLDEVVSIIIQ